MKLRENFICFGGLRQLNTVRVAGDDPLTKETRFTGNLDGHRVSHIKY